MRNRPEISKASINRASIGQPVGKRRKTTTAMPPAMKPGKSSTTTTQRRLWPAENLKDAIQDILFQIRAPGDNTRTSPLSNKDITLLETFLPGLTPSQLYSVVSLSCKVPSANLVETGGKLCSSSLPETSCPAIYAEAGKLYLVAPELSSSTHARKRGHIDAGDGDTDGGAHNFICARKCVAPGEFLSEEQRDEEIAVMYNSDPTLKSLVPNSSRLDLSPGSRWYEIRGLIYYLPLTTKGHIESASTSSRYVL